MAYTEFYVTTGANASDLNAGYPLGTGDGPTYNYDNSSIATLVTSSGTANPYTLVRTDSGNFTGVNTDDFCTFDTDSTKVPLRVVSGGGTASLTVNRVDGSSGALGASKKMRVGGAFLTPNGILSKIGTGWVNAAGNAPRVNVKYATYASTVTAGNSGTLALPITVEGYTTTAGDGGVPTGTAVWTIGKDYWRFKNLYLNITGATALDGSGGNYHRYENVTAKSTTSMAFYGASRSLFIGCTCTGAGYTGFYAVVPTMIGCVAVDCAYAGFNPLYGGFLTNCVAARSTGTGRGFWLQNTGDGAMVNCVAVSNAGDGIYVDTSTYGARIVNCVLSRNGGYGINRNGSAIMVEDFNAFDTNTSGAKNNLPLGGENDVTLSASPFIDPANNDFRINPRSAAGRALLNVNAARTVYGKTSPLALGAFQLPVLAALQLQ